MKYSLVTKCLFASALGLIALSPLAIQNASAKAEIRIGANIGLRLPNGSIRIAVGKDNYHYNKGRYYRKTDRGYVVVKAPRGARLKRLPSDHRRVIVSGRTFFLVGSTYYRKVDSQYVVVDAPQHTQTATPETPNLPALSVWDGDQEYLFKSGHFFRNTSKGLVWIATPYGAISSDLPADAETVWYQEIEYFQSHETHFKKTPDGYKIVAPPWDAPE